eukprot:TRINITY_DN19743_c0_g1_i1.p2 TRINITY_DN19743_c0_g1~~TRINITY_DN19743_c0_g1_i1.p2  ORF type:complete len:273 (+),score=53.69 TRINITY_DN19743_c0_g1_i1:46-819(+)
MMANVLLVAIAVLGGVVKDPATCVLKSDKGPAKGSGQEFHPSASASMSTGWYEEDLPAWGDLPDSRFVEVPRWLVGVTATVPGHWLKAETIVEFHCPKKITVKWIDLEVCDAFVFLYRCPLCKVETGNVEQLLLAEGWTVSSCGPKFKTGFMGGNGYSHKMITLRKQFPPGSTLSFTTPNTDVEFIAFGTSSFGTDCSTRFSVQACDDISTSTNGACMWDYTSKMCVHTDFCPRIPGPTGEGHGGCAICPNDELAKM